MGLRSALFGDRRRRRKRARKAAADAGEDAVEGVTGGCTGGCCLEIPLVLALAGLTGRRALRARR